MPTINDVLDAFTALGGTTNQSGALKAHLENLGFNSSDVVTAINSALNAGCLILDSRTDAIHKPTN